MTQITKNFTLEEFNCKDGSKIPSDVEINIRELAKNLQALRDHTGKAIHVNSGYRSLKYNLRVGGEKNSQHTKGNAGDITIKGMAPREVALTIEKLIDEGKMKQGGIGIYKTFTHYDIRGAKARW